MHDDVNNAAREAYHPGNSNHVKVHRQVNKPNNK